MKQVKKYLSQNYFNGYTIRAKARVLINEFFVYVEKNNEYGASLLSIDFKKKEIRLSNLDDFKKDGFKIIYEDF